MDLRTARKGQAFIAQNGRIAIYLGRDENLKRPHFFRVGDQLWSRQQDGRHCEKCDGTVYPAIVKRAPKD